VWSDDDCSVFRALVGLVSIAAELVLNVTNSTGGPPVRSTAADALVSVRDPACGGD